MGHSLRPVNVNWGGGLSFWVFTIDDESKTSELFQFSEEVSPEEKYKSQS